ncbi:DNA polymerase III subunit chi [bacterium]|nr:DNA polymerase III subunit chi [bacterium]
MLQFKVDIKKVNSSVSELLFYHLENRPVGEVLPTLLEKTLDRGWRATVECGSDEILAQLDKQLWTFRDDSFLPHSAQSSESSPTTPILLTRAAENENSSNVRFFVGGARPRDEKSYDRLVYLFDGHNAEFVENARADWRQLKENFDVTYWQQSQNGRWEKKA